MLRAFAIGLAIAAVVFLLTGGHVLFLPILFLPFLFSFGGARRQRRSRGAARW